MSVVCRRATTLLGLWMLHRYNQLFVVLVKTNLFDLYIYAIILSPTTANPSMTYIAPLYLQAASAR